MGGRINTIRMVWWVRRAGTTDGYKTYLGGYEMSCDTYCLPYENKLKVSHTIDLGHLSVSHFHQNLM